jgi:predicted alpha/beta superfamily hydrolase
MRWFRFILAAIFSFFTFPGFAQHTICFEITSLPAYHPVASDVFLAGSFNGWNPQHESFKFGRNENGKFILRVKLASGYYEYKITRGGWDKVECTAAGTDVPNRMVRVSGDTTLVIAVEGWKDFFSPVAGSRKSTAGKNVRILDTAFAIPQLQRTRRIWIYLPQDYESSFRRYPVLYMHDGQNVFDDATSFTGEWGVDEGMDTMMRKCIVVAIDNGGSRRLNEYCPYDFSLTGIAAVQMSGKGEGREYVDFLVQTLKPFIDKRYRTQPGRRHTFIAGSSMGGLISMYALLRYPQVFGGAGVFSPAFWVGPTIFDDIKLRGKKVKGKIWFYAGGAESESMVPDTEKAYELMKKFPASEEKLVVVQEGRHNESQWRQQFPLFYQWIIR